MRFYACLSTDRHECKVPGFSVSRQVFTADLLYTFISIASVLIEACIYSHRSLIKLEASMAFS